MSREVLCLAPHPDDESIGCGGTLAQHAAAGDRVRIVWLTSGEAAAHDGPPEALAAIREQEAEAAASLLGAEVGGLWRLPDGQVEPDDRHVQHLERLLAHVDVLYAPHLGDGHPDHRAVGRLAAQVASGRRDLQAWGYEVWTPIAEPVWVNDISDFIAAKVAAIRAHATQCALVAFDDAAEGLARYRAHLHCWPGQATHAEAFAGLAGED